ncbi:MAG: hypothetical protein DRI34_00655 [Deltaproteobacteria bacterium]|nr:MAG: hypothetical protein DRI34_00655 [Deltaproteobacteria bacterium]
MGTGDNNDQQALERRVEQLVERLAEQIARGIVDGLASSQLFQRWQQRLDDLEKRLARSPSSAPAPEAGKRAAPSPGLGLPLSSLANLIRNKPPAGKPAPRPRRVVSRPTISYRVDPRKDSKASGKNNICSEPGCDRPATTRGLCATHYQRLRYRERKITQKQSSSSPLPPPPPPPRRQANRGGTRAVFAMLYEEKGKKVLAGLINQVKFGRSDLVERLNQMFAGMPGIPLEEEDVLRALHYHKLAGALHRRESESIFRHLHKQRGSLAKTAQKMKTTLEKLKERISELEIDEEVTRIRNEFKEEILEHSDFRQRLDLALTKEKYLVDLGIEEEVDASLKKELDAQLADLDTSDGNATRDSICRALSLDEERYQRLVRRFGMGAGGDERQLGGST